MSERNAVQRAFDDWGRASGLEKRSGSWYRVSAEIISVSNLQKSQYGPLYYVNQAFWLRQLGHERYPKDFKCHIRLRLDSLLGDGTTRLDLDRLLDMDHPMDEVERVAKLTSVLSDRLVPVIERGSSVAGLRSLLNEGAFRAAGISGPAQELLAATSAA